MYIIYIYFKQIPSLELTYPLPKAHFWRWFSFSSNGICWFPGGYLQRLPDMQKHKKHTHELVAIIVHWIYKDGKCTRNTSMDIFVPNGCQLESKPTQGGVSWGQWCFCQIFHNFSGDCVKMEYWILEQMRHDQIKQWNQVINYNSR